MSRYWPFSSRGAPADPTGGDRHLLMVLLLGLATAASLSPIRSYDYWWHLATGSWILQHRAIPGSDPFSFTAGGTDWVDHEWLFQILACVGHTTLGPAVLVLLKVSLVLAVCLLMARHLGRAGHGPAGSAVILTPVLLGAAFRLDVRPELATMVLLPILVHLVLLARDTDRRGPLLLLPPLVILWANLHVGVIVAPAVLALGLVGTLVARVLTRHRGEHIGGADPAARFTVRLAWTTLAAAICVGVNPYGWRIYAVPFELSRLLATLPWPNLEWARPGFADFPLFWICLGAATIITLIAARHADPFATPALLLIAVLAAAHLRNVGLFFFLLPYGIGRPARALVNDLSRRRLYRLAAFEGHVRPGFIGAAVLLAASVPLLVLLPPGVTFGLGVASYNEPAPAVDFLEREGVGERLFNDVKFGGYLIWRRYPAARVFIDGRNEVYGDLLHEIDAGLQDPGSWNRLLDRYRIDSAFLRYPPTLQRVLYGGDGDRPQRTGLRAFAAAYFHDDGWALVYWDDDAMVFLRRVARYEDVIKRLEYRAIHPDDWRHIYAGVVRQQIPLTPIVAEIERKLAEDPSCRRARWLQRTFASLAGENAGAEPGVPGGGR